MELLGDIRGKTVLDLGCGEGFYSRKLKLLGAKTVVGVDISQEMIRLARQQEGAKPLGCAYVVGDVNKIVYLGRFDLVFGSYLLNYAQTRDELARFCRCIFSNLKPGGCFIGINNNPANPMVKFETYKKYGLSKSTKSQVLVEGTPINYDVKNPDGTVFSFKNYYIAPEDHEAIFYQTGFDLFEWHQPFLSETGRKNFERGYWDAFLDYPPIIGIFARRKNDCA